MFGDRIHLKVGERLRIFFANAGPNLVSSFHVVGGIFDRVVSGHFDDVSHDEETIAVAPGSAAVFELTFPVAGTYSMLDHALSHAQRGAVGLVHVDGDAAQSGELYSPEPHVTGKH